MKKFAITKFSILSILLLSLTSSILLLGVESAEGVIVSMQWGHLQVINGNTDETEKAIEEDVCDYIYNIFDNEYYDSWATVNAYWDYTDTDGIVACMGWQNDAENDVDFVANWWVGDFLPAPIPPDEFGEPPPFGHFWFYGDADNVSDAFVDEWTTMNGTISSKQKFNFIWTCANGGTYWTDSSGNFNNITGIFYGAATPTSPPPQNTNDEYGFFDGGAAVGMPLAWTNTSSMNLDGYNYNQGSYCYIGFEGSSPFMKNYLPDTQVRADNFPMAFYIYAIGPPYTQHYHKSIAESLDFASDYTYDCEFDETELYDGYWTYVTGKGWFICRMRVFGNGSMILPYW